MSVNIISGFLCGFHSIKAEFSIIIRIWSVDHSLVLFVLLRVNHSLSLLWSFILMSLLHIRRFAMWYYVAAIEYYLHFEFIFSTGIGYSWWVNPFIFCVGLGFHHRKFQIKINPPMFCKVIGKRTGKILQLMQQSLMFIIFEAITMIWKNKASTLESFECLYSTCDQPQVSNLARNWHTQQRCPSEKIIIYDITNLATWSVRKGNCCSNSACIHCQRNVFVKLNSLIKYVHL